MKRAQLYSFATAKFGSAQNVHIVGKKKGPGVL